MRTRTTLGELTALPKPLTISGGGVRGEGRGREGGNRFIPVLFPHFGPRVV